MNINEIKNSMIPRKVKEICWKCESNIHCRNKGCAFRSLGNEYCDEVLLATQEYLEKDQEIKRLNNELQDFKVQDISNQEQLYNLIEENEKLNNMKNNLWDYLSKAKEVTTGEYKNAIKDIMHFIEPYMELKEKEND